MTRPDPDAFGTTHLILGVTGHRDLPMDDQEPLRMAVFNLLQKLLASTPHLTLLTGLAEGADRLAAQIANDSGIPHIAVLPRPVDAYLHDFDTRQSRSQFHRLLKSSAEMVIAQPDPHVKGYTEQALSIAARSHTVLAMWDGQDNSSGTAEVVRFCLKGFSHDGIIQTRPVWWLPARNGPAAPAMTPELKLLPAHHL